MAADLRFLKVFWKRGSGRLRPFDRVLMAQVKLVQDLPRQLVKHENFIKYELIVLNLGTWVGGTCTALPFYQFSK